MIGANSCVPNLVHTPHGVKDVGELVPGDKLFEYRTGNLLEVIDTTKTEVSDIWELSYSDGRSQLVNITGNVFTGIRPASLISVLKSNGEFSHHVEIYPVELKRSLTRPLNPDPYVAGALIMYGCYDDEFINLPLSMVEVNSLLAHKYQLDYAEKLGDSTAYFRYDGTPDDRCITWQEFFKGEDFFARGKDIDLPLIPDEYMFASITDRRKFVSGAFDIGHNNDMFPDTLGIIGKYEYRLKELQKMLWTLGVNSIVSFDYSISAFVYGYNFRLDVVGDHNQSTAFFYDADNIARMLKNERSTVWKTPEFQLKIIGVRRYCKGWMYEPVLRKPNMLYLDANCLPRVSM